MGGEYLLFDQFDRPERAWRTPVDFEHPAPAADAQSSLAPRRAPHRRGYLFTKRALDLGLAIVLLPCVAFIALGIFLLNPVLNPGPLFYTQLRLGRDAVPFRIYKFRTMSEVGPSLRGAADPLEVHRIPPFGAMLRRSRFDELPQILNILRGEMSFIGPRPDLLTHAEIYVENVPFYDRRFAVRPGISGLAQVTLGYAEGLAATRAKALRDQVYIRHAGFWLDARITWLTLRTLVLRQGR